jgi:hypothetical protein
MDAIWAWEIVNHSVLMSAKRSSSNGAGASPVFWHSRQEYDLILLL